jgi:glycosyltransferase involved in cell wall biosynthesis
MATPKKYTLVGINYWPEPTGNSPYNTGLSEKLQETDEICVITGQPHYPWWKKQSDHSDKEYLDVHKNIFLNRVNHFVPRKQSNFARAAMEIDFGIRAIATGKVAGEKIILISPAMISSALVLAWVRVFSRESKVLLWVQDLYEQGLEETARKRGFFAQVVVRIENWLLSNVDRVVVAHPRFLTAKNLDISTQKHFALANWSHFDFQPSESIDKTKQKYGFGESEVILHIGNMGVKQGLEHVLDSARLAQRESPRLKFVFVGGGNQIDKLKDFVIQNLLTNVSFIEPVTDEELSNLMNSASVLLVHEAPGVKEMSIPSKLSTYFLTGRPILVCSEPDSLAGMKVREDGTGSWVRSGNEGELLRGIDRILQRASKDEESRALLFANENLRKGESLEKFKRIIDEL